MLCVWVTVQAQEPGPVDIRPVEKVLGFTLGVQNRQLLDEQKSALTYASQEHFAGLFYRRESSKSLFKLSLSAGTGDFYAKHFKDRWLYSSIYSIEGTQAVDSFPVTATLTGGNLELDFLLKLNPGRRTTWLAGASVKERLVYTDNKTGMLNSLGLHANVGLITEFGTNSKLRVNFSVPLVALNSRLPWHNTASDPIDSEIKTFFKKGTTVAGPGDFSMPELAVDYEIRLTRGLGLGAGYGFTWLHIPAVQPLKSVLHTFQLQILFKL